MSFTVFLAMLESVLVSKQPFLLLLMYCGYANYNTHGRLSSFIKNFNNTVPVSGLCLHISPFFMTMFIFIWLLSLFYSQWVILYAVSVSIYDEEK